MRGMGLLRGAVHTNTLGGPWFCCAILTPNYRSAMVQAGLIVHGWMRLSEPEAEDNAFLVVC